MAQRDASVEQIVITRLLRVSAVVYGLVGLKTHCKLSMVVRQEKSVLRRYVHIGTGNYNPATARGYEDLGILTADKELGRDVGDLFNFLTGYSRRGKYESLLVAPHELRERMVALIQREAEHARAGREARLMFKLNSLVDEPIGRADAEFVRQRTGFAIGGVAPVAHAEPLTILIDEDLLQWPEIWAAAGHPNTVFKLTPADLVRLTGGRVAAVKSETRG